MDRSRCVEGESDTAVPASGPAKRPAHAAAPGGAATARLLHYQSTGGNQMVIRLLAAARDAASRVGADPAGGAAAAGPPAAAAGPPAAERIRSRLGGGSPLPAQVRAEAEAGFGRPLGEVRLHTDAPAAALATQLDAHAFTTGNDIFFNSGVYDPGSRGGYEVLVHELTHTLQRSSAPVSGRLAAGTVPTGHRRPAEHLSVSDVHDPDEREARAIAARLAAQRGARPGSAHAGPAPVGRSHPSSVQRSSAGAGGPLVVHRHASWEHTLLGDARPDQVGEAVVQVKDREHTAPHLLQEMFQQIKTVGERPADDPRQKFPDVRWFQLAGSGMWVSNGELNALADYLPGPAAADTMTRDQLIPVLQKMRSEMLAALTRVEHPSFSSYPLEGMATHPAENADRAGGAVWALDAATAGLNHDRYQGLLAKNACHFAPFSWQRWEQFHNEAAEHARAHFANRSDARPLTDVPKGTEENARQALLKNGYADHFLQDSFAAGHLVNKALVMQWWVEYLNEHYRSPQAPGALPGSGLPPSAGQLDARVLDRMSTQAQPGVAGRDLYQHPLSKQTKRDDREHGTGVTDPQTAQERTDPQRRRSGSGVTGANDEERDENYQAYLHLLNNAGAQGATKGVHDHFNKSGLTVVNGNGVRMRVGGDDSLLRESDRTGAALAAEAARLSRQAIDELLNTGRTAITTEQIFGYVPIAVVPDGTSEPIPLEQWHNTTLRKLCDETIFPAYETSGTLWAGETWPEMVAGGVSPDVRPLSPSAPR